MKSLRSMFVTESANYKPKFSIQEWDSVLKLMKPKYSNYSHLGGIDTGVADDGWNMDSYSEMADDCFDSIDAIAKKVRNVTDIMWDMTQFIYNDCGYTTLGYSDDREDIDNFKSDKTPYDWGVEAEDYYYTFEGPKDGTLKKYSALLAEYGDNSN